MTLRIDIPSYLELVLVGVSLSQAGFHATTHPRTGIAFISLSSLPLSGNDDHRTLALWLKKSPILERDTHTW